MRFIKLTPWDTADQPYYVNFYFVQYMERRGVGSQAYTRVAFSDENYLPVKETPEQILALLSAPTAP